MAMFNIPGAEILGCGPSRTVEGAVAFLFPSMGGIFVTWGGVKSYNTYWE